MPLCLYWSYKQLVLIYCYITIRTRYNGRAHKGRFGDNSCFTDTEYRPIVFKNNPEVAN